MAHATDTVVIPPIHPMPVMTHVPPNSSIGVARSPVPAEETRERSEARPKTQEVEQAVDDLNQHFDASSTALQFRMDREAGRMVVSVVDAKDGTVLRQIPGEVALRLARNLERMRIHLIEESA